MSSRCARTGKETADLSAPLRSVEKHFQEKSAELALQAAQDRYDAGASTLVELTQARATQVDGASAVVTARYNEMFQRTLIGYYIGALDPGKLSGQVR